MRFFGFFLGMCEANAFSAYRIFSDEGRIRHSFFKDNLAWCLLQHCKRLMDEENRVPSINQGRTSRATAGHHHVSMSGGIGHKRKRLACKGCINLGVRGTRVEKSCSCSPEIPRCQSCYNKHLFDVWSSKARLNNSL